MSLKNLFRHTGSQNCLNQYSVVYEFNYSYAVCIGQTFCNYCIFWIMRHTWIAFNAYCLYIDAWNLECTKQNKPQYALYYTNVEKNTFKLSASFKFFLHMVQLSELLSTQSHIWKILWLFIHQQSWTVYNISSRHWSILTST